MLNIDHNKMNVYLDFYEKLLTDKQQSIMNNYYRDDFSLREIAENMQITRSAVSDSIKRATQSIVAYEKKLKLIQKYQVREAYYEELANVDNDIVQMICKKLKESEIESYE